MALGQLPIQLLCISIHVFLQQVIQCWRILELFFKGFHTRIPVQHDRRIAAAGEHGLLGQVNILVL